MVTPAEVDDGIVLIDRAVKTLTRRTPFPVAFGGLEHDGAIHVTSIAGARTRSLTGLIVQPQRGLGGQALIEKRPRLTSDYRTARTITHDYDRAVLGEGITTLFAVPIVTGGRARGMLYCGSWSQTAVGDDVARSAFRIADELAGELRIGEEVARRLAVSAPPPGAPGLDGAAREELRESYAELRSIAATVHDAGIRQRLERLERRLAALSNDEAGHALEVGLSPREIDVLACAALGSTNGAIAKALDLREGTVKSYLASAMSKLDAPTRHAAVATARRAGILP